MEACEAPTPYLYILSVPTRSLQRNSQLTRMNALWKSSPKV